MATYKVLQDIEAEDTLIGPLTLRQCIYAAIAVVGIYLSVVFVTKHAAFFVLFMLPFIGFGIFFAFPWSKQQSTEVWALAKIRFFLKPRKRIWNQSGVKELVTITVPKNIKRAYASALTPIEVSSRLKALADTIDSRGWAIKNVDLGYYTKPGVLSRSASDRLVSQSNLPQEVPNYDASAAEDIFDVQNNPVAQKFDAMMTQSADNHRQQIMQQMAQPQPATTGPFAEPGLATPENPWHLRTIAPLPNGPMAQPPTYTPPQQPQYAQPQQPMQQTRYQQPQAAQQQPVQPTIQQRMPDLQLPAVMPSPSYAQASQYTAQTMQELQNTVTGHASPAILELANNNDLNVATIAREAQARSPAPTDEVIISLH